MIKKILSFTLACCMIFGLSTAAFAAPDDYSVKVENGFAIFMRRGKVVTKYSVKNTNFKVTTNPKTGNLLFILTDATGKTRYISVGKQKTLNVDGTMDSLAVDRRLEKGITVNVMSTANVKQLKVSNYYGKVVVKKGAKIREVRASSAANITGVNLDNAYNLSGTGPWYDYYYNNGGGNWHPGWNSGSNNNNGSFVPPPGPILPPLPPIIGGVATVSLASAELTSASTVLLTLSAPLDITGADILVRRDAGTQGFSGSTPLYSPTGFSVAKVTVATASTAATGSQYVITLVTPLTAGQKIWVRNVVGSKILLEKEPVCTDALGGNTQTFDEARAAVEKALLDYVATNATTADDVINLVKGAVTNSNITIAWSDTAIFVKVLATTQAKGFIAGKIILSLTVDATSATVTIDAAKEIAVLDYNDQPVQIRPNGTLGSNSNYDFKSQYSAAGLTVKAQDNFASITVPLKENLNIPNKATILNTLADGASSVEVGFLFAGPLGATSVQIADSVAKLDAADSISLTDANKTIGGKLLRSFEVASKSGNEWNQTVTPASETIFFKWLNSSNAEACITRATIRKESAPKLGQVLATINIKVDGSHPKNPGSIDVQIQNTTGTKTKVYHSIDGAYTANVDQNTTYKILVDGKDSKQNIVTKTQDATATIQMYTIKYDLNASGNNTTSSVNTITATSDSTPLTNGVTVFGSTTVTFTVVDSSTPSDIIKWKEGSTPLSGATDTSKTFDVVYDKTRGKVGCELIKIQTINTITLSVKEPVTDVAPTTKIQETLSNLKSNTITWSKPDDTAHTGKFDSDTIYTANVTLTAADGYKRNDHPAITATDTAATPKTITPTDTKVSSDKSELTFQLTFIATKKRTATLPTVSLSVQNGISATLEFDKLGNIDEDTKVTATLTVSGTPTATGKQEFEVTSNHLLDNWAADAKNPSTPLAVTAGSAITSQTYTYTYTFNMPGSDLTADAFTIQNIFTPTYALESPTPSAMHGITSSVSITNASDTAITRVSKGDTIKIVVTFNGSSDANGKHKITLTSTELGITTGNYKEITMAKQSGPASGDDKLVITKQVNSINSDINDITVTHDFTPLYTVTEPTAVTANGVKATVSFTAGSEGGLYAEGDKVTATVTLSGTATDAHDHTALLAVATNDVTLIADSDNPSSESIAAGDIAKKLYKYTFTVEKADVTFTLSHTSAATTPPSP